jgi:hypothetical protein
MLRPLFCTDMTKRLVKLEAIVDLQNGYQEDHCKKILGGLGECPGEESGMLVPSFRRRNRPCQQSMLHRQTKTAAGQGNPRVCLADDHWAVNDSSYLLHCAHSIHLIDFRP